ncbi:MAG TPA: hypothetical protein VG267_15245 [Terracidiphilus sp.]|jgi:hypothetical protein|nr:hypothetical protein [Terracidiphilus sp.]
MTHEKERETVEVESVQTGVRIVAAAMAGACSIAMGQASPSPATKRAHAETSFDVVVHAPYVETAELFGPEGERAWAGKHWDPQFIFPDAPRDEQGAVFTIQHGPLQAVWVIAQHDLAARHFQYVYFIPETMVCTIDLRFTPVDAATTKVHVTYARTAVSPDGDEHVAAMSDDDRKAGVKWQAAIDRYKSGLDAPHGH